MAKNKKAKQVKINQSVPDNPPSPVLETIARLNEQVEKHSYLVFASCLLLLIVYVFRQFLFLDQVYLFKDIGSDSVNGFLPQPVHLWDYVRKEGIPKWSFNTGMGQNLFGFSFGDPFMFLFMLVSKANIPFAMAYIESLKFFLAGTFFFLFLRTLRVSAFPAIAGGLMYAFSGYMMVGSGWYNFSIEGLYFSLLLFSLELFTSRKTWFVFPIAIALIGSYQPFHLYLSALLSAGYVIFRSLFWSEFDWKKIFLSMTKLAGLGLLGIALSGIFLFSNMEQILQSPRGSGETSYFHVLSTKPVFSFADPIQYVSILMRDFSSDMLGTGNEFKGWQNYLESPMSYCGLICFLLVPVFFFSVDKKKKILLAIATGICIIPLIFPYFRYMFWMFSGDYFRAFSLFEILVFLLISIGGLQLAAERKTNGLVIAGSLLVALLILYFPYREKDSIINNDLRWNATLFLIVYSALLWMMNSRALKQVAKPVFLLVLLVELGSFSSAPLEKRKTIRASELKEKTGYNDYSVEALASLQSKDSSFYRIIKDYSSGPAMHGSLNDARVQGFYGTASYHSFPQKYYIDFFQKMGVIHAGNEIEARWVPGLLGRPLLQPLTSVKYILSKRTDYNPAGMGYDSAGKIGDVRIYKNRYFLPLGYTYSQWIPETEFLTLSPNVKDAVMLRACVSPDDAGFKEIPKFNLKDSAVALTFDFFKATTDSLRRDTLHITKQGQNIISGDISMEKRKILFFSIPFDNGWKATVDGIQTELSHCNIGFMGLLLDKGTHHVELAFEPPYLKSGAWVSESAILVFLALLFVFRKKSEPPVTSSTP